MGESIHKSAKFGGTSMAQPDVVASIVADSPEIDIVVVSAPGKAEGVEIKMTDQLIKLAEFAIDGAQKQTEFEQLSEALIGRFETLYDEIGEERLKVLRGMATACFNKIAKQSNAVDFAMSIGEELSAKYFTELLQFRGIDAEYVDPEEWVTFSESGVLDRDETANKLSEIAKQAAENGNKIVTPGFYGYDSEGNRHLLGRGGSDRTGALAAVVLAKLHGDENVVYENWTDQDGILTGDPRKITGTKVITELTRDEVREGANGGSGVLHGNTIIDLLGSKIRIILRNTFNVNNPGTAILKERKIEPRKPVVAISGKKLNLLTIKDMGMADTPGYAEAVLAVISEAGISFEHIPASRDAFSLTFSGAFSENELTAIVDKIYAAIQTVSPDSNAKITAEQKNVIYLVGEALKNPKIRTSVTGKLCRVMKHIGILSHIDHHTSPSIAILLPEDDEIEPYMQLLHDEFIGVSVKSRISRMFGGLLKKFK